MTGRLVPTTAVTTSALCFGLATALGALAFSSNIYAMILIALGAIHVALVARSSQASLPMFLALEVGLVVIAVVAALLHVGGTQILDDRFWSSVEQILKAELSTASGLASLAKYVAARLSILAFATFALSALAVRSWPKAAMALRSFIAVAAVQVAIDFAYRRPLTSMNLLRPGSQQESARAIGFLSLIEPLSLFASVLLAATLVYISGSRASMPVSEAEADRGSR